MAEFEIFVDSCANIPSEIRLRRNIRLIPFIITVNGEEFICGDEAKDEKETAKRFYQKMREDADVKSSLIVEERFSDAFKPALEEGKDVVFVSLSSGLSGSFAQAETAKKSLSAKYPERKIYILDSANASLGEGLLALKIADLRDLGEDAASCAEWFQDNVYKMNSYFTVDDLKYLRKSGRISLTLAIAGTILNIKPLLTADAGINAKICSYGKVRGRKKAIQAIVEAFEQHVESPEAQTIAIAHADCEEDALELAAMLKERGAGEIIMNCYDICSGAHVGPGTLALFFMGDDRRGAQPAPAKFKPFAKTATNNS